MYNHYEIEKKWNDYWIKNKIYKIKDNPKKEKFYLLDMFPYPSGFGIHVGHCLGYIATDILARYKRLNNFNVFYAMGWDAFGLPAEQYALKTKKNPKTFTQINIQYFKKQIQNLGLSYDWDKEINTSDPRYYRNTQWVFLLLLKKGLAEIKEVEVNWCPELKIVLSDEELVKDKNNNLVSERGGHPVFKKPMKQWVLKISKYAKKLYDNLDLLNWPSSIIKLQKNWLYNSDGTLHLRDWVFSRQRYWGEPFPVAFDENGQIATLENLPIELPELENITPSGTGESPLANAKDWLYIEIDGKKYRRDTNTMPQWAGSCWYYIAYILKNDDGSYLNIESKEAYQRLKKWLPVDLYVGGQEHAVLHLLYARFWHIVLNEEKIVSTIEPFQKLFNQGIILASDNTKMSKSKNNIVNPNDIIGKYGADTLRLYIMFMGPIEETKKWSDSAINGIYYFIVNIWNTISSIKIGKSKVTGQYHLLIKQITNLVEKMRYNLAISKIMVFINLIKKEQVIAKDQLEGFLIMLGIFAPYIGQELLTKFNFKNHWEQTWPSYDENLIEEKEYLIVQINGKFKDKINLEEKLLTKDENIALDIAKTSLKIKKYLENKRIQTIIYKKEYKIINIVLK